MQARVVLVQVVLVLASTLGIIIPVAFYLRPPEGYRLPRFSETSGQSVVPRTPKMQLSLMLRIIGEVDRSPQTELNRAQAKRFLKLIAPWRSRSRMSDEESRLLTKNLSVVLSDKQRAKMSEMYSLYEGSRGSGGLSGQSAAWQAFRQIYNPFYAPDGYKEFHSLSSESQARYKQRYADRMALLKRWKLKAQ